MQGPFIRFGKVQLHYIVKVCFFL